MSGLPALVIVLPADLDQRQADRLRPALLEAAEAGRDLVIDMRDAATIDPAGLGLLVRAHRSARQHGAALCLVAPSRFVLTVLHTMRLDGVFPIFPDQRTTLSELARAAAMA
jgi:anti-sigma B factor antagonist